MKFRLLTFILMFCFSGYVCADNNVYIAPKASSMTKPTFIPPVSQDNIDPSIGVVPNDAYYPPRPYPPYPPRPPVSQDSLDPSIGVIPNDAYNDFENNIYHYLAPGFVLPLPNSKIVISDGQSQKIDNKEDKVHRYEVNKDSITIGVGKQR